MDSTSGQLARPPPLPSTGPPDDARRAQLEALAARLVEAILAGDRGASFGLLGALTAMVPRPSRG